MGNQSIKDIPDEAVFAAWLYCLGMTPGNRPSPYEILCTRFQYKVALRKLEKMCKQGKIEYGVSIRWYWPTHLS